MAENGKPDRLLATALIAVGVLVLALSGTCTANFLAAGGFGVFPPGRPRPSPFNAANLILFLIFGAPFLALGAATALAGLRLLRTRSGIGTTLIGWAYLWIGGFGMVLSVLFFLNRPNPLPAILAVVCGGVAWLGWRTMAANDPRG